MSARADRPVCVIGIDVGGTKIKAGAVAPVALRRVSPLIVAREIPTPRVPPGQFYDVIAELIRAVAAQAREAGAAVLPLVALAQPGRFLPDATLARGTTPNLGTAPDQYDGVAPAQELQRRLGGTVIAENDAIAQMRFGLDALLRESGVRPHLLGQTVVYLGPGTGMGGGVARVSLEGEVQVITDGHLFDLQICGWGDGTQIAEELFNGPAVSRVIAEANRHLAQPIEPARAGRLSEILSGPDTPLAHRVEATRIAAHHGEILAALIRTIHAGRIQKVRLETLPEGRTLRHVDEPDRRWPPADQAALRGASRILLGGFIGSNIPFGGLIRCRALEVLAQHGLQHIQIFQIPLGSADAGLLGVIRAIPATLLRDLGSACGSQAGSGILSVIDQSHHAETPAKTPHPE